MTVIVAGDEAGDASFAFGKGASAYFVLAVIVTYQPEGLREELARFRQRRQMPESWEFSFHDLTSLRLKGQVFALLKGLPFTAKAIVIDKRRLPEPFLAMSKQVFYAFFASELIRRIPESEREGAILLLDEFDRAGKSVAELMRTLKARKIHRGFKKILGKRSKGEPLIQIADLVAGAVLARYSKGNDRFLKMVEEKLLEIVEYPPKEKPPS